MIAGGREREATKRGNDGGNVLAICFHLKQEGGSWYTRTEEETEFQERGCREESVSLTAKVGERESTREAGEKRQRQFTPQPL